MASASYHLNSPENKKMSLGVEGIRHRISLFLKIRNFMQHFDYVIVGGGIIGLTLAKELASTRPPAKIALFEKETSTGFHASGRNSGVVHAGLYYPPGSLKALLCVEGARKLREYVQARNLPYAQVGKLLVASTDEDLPRLDLIEQRSKANGVPVERLTQSQAREIEPAAKTHRTALLSPLTAVIDNKSVLASLVEELKGKITLRFGASVERLEVEAGSFEAGGERFSYGHLINTAGAYADKLAHRFGIGEQYRLLPFRGAYVGMTAPWTEKIRHLIYPTPDLSLPFLGVHVTKSVHGKIWVGPTAVPALGREHYQGLRGIELEGAGFLGEISRMWLMNKNNMRRHVRSEVARLWPANFLSELRGLLPGVSGSDLSAEVKSGIRAQLVDTKNHQLVMDFLVLPGKNSTHVLNAVSPAYTASFAFANWLNKQIP